MSYILDALKKSAEERRRVQQSSPLLGQPATYPAEGRQKTGGLLPLLATLLLCLSLAAAGSWYWLVVRPIPGGTPQDATTARVRPKERQAASVNSETADLPASTAERREAASPLSRQQPEQAATNPAQDLAATPAKTRAGIPLLTDLPPAMQAAIPDIRFSGHVFSPVASRRMIMANQTVVREQDLLSPEVRLEEITETGVLLSYRGTRFRIELLPPR